MKTITLILFLFLSIKSVQGEDFDIHKSYSDLKRLLKNEKVLLSEVYSLLNIEETDILAISGGGDMPDDFHSLSLVKKGASFFVLDITGSVQRDLEKGRISKVQIAEIIVYLPDPTTQFKASEILYSGGKIEKRKSVLSLISEIEAVKEN